MMKRGSKLFVLIFIIALLFSSCTKSDINYNLTFEEISNIAEQKKKPFCLVVVNDSTSCFYSKYLLQLDKFNIWKKAEINIIELSNGEENEWYRQWLCSLNPIITCLFSADGELEAIIAGNSTYSFRYLEEALRGNMDNSDFGYISLFSSMDKETKIKFLDETFKCKIQLDKKFDIEQDIDKTFELSSYPFNVYLKLLSEQSKNKKDNSIIYANELLSFDDIIYYYPLYSGLFEYAMQVIDTNYLFENRPKILVNSHEIDLDSCNIDEAKYFEVTLFNSGVTDLIIKTVKLSCNCVELLTEELPIIKPETSNNLKFKFLPDAEGEIERKIIILSNAQNNLEEITIKALSHRKEV